MGWKRRKKEQYEEQLVDRAWKEFRCCAPIWVEALLYNFSIVKDRGSQGLFAINRVLKQIILFSPIFLKIYFEQYIQTEFQKSDLNVLRVQIWKKLVFTLLLADA